ncbi:MULTISPECIES: hypothetical protein [unclassified Oceanispirochaeta]|uniref:hypothetical protein n=1 Tax=unclassified Oceanispirochaeta TaxID=2635722 RepID=UPI000E08E02C|nr:MULTISPECIES: hypothetical protein [unclassified Oceanispirochaeta]MBF9018621.1 hypothetical protein [Oceanispirochaeta sp. M2]NPD75058.1 hypothetical protein [Oceanispirochaeta sp. M1]RDG29084.1 hypothetical protein DV872_23460 [Oceanispirochaeta sp. M1]
MQPHHLEGKSLKILIIRFGQDSSALLDKQFFDKAYDLIHESLFKGRISQDEFWRQVIYQDFSAYETEEEMDKAYASLLEEHHPVISVLFGCNLYEGNDVNWSEYKIYKAFSGLKFYKSEYYQRCLNGSHIYQINLQDPLVSNYNEKAMLRILNQFGDDYYVKFQHNND